MNIKYTDVMKPADISIAHCWLLFAGAVIPTGASAAQREDMRRAFYGGFVECFKITTDIATALPEGEASAVLDRLSKESHAFFLEMMSRYK